MKWYIIKTKPQNEYRVAQHYLRAGIESFNPEYLETNLRGEQVKKPLFKTYLFVNTNLEQTFNIIKYARGVSHIISFGTKQAEVDTTIINSLRARLDTTGFIRMNYRNKFKQGDPVRIKIGMFKDFEAVFDRQLSETERVQILLGAVDAPKGVKIHPCYLEKI